MFQMESQRKGKERSSAWCPQILFKYFLEDLRWCQKKFNPLPPNRFQKRAEKKGKKRSERGPKKVHKIVLQLFKVLKMVPMKVNSHKKVLKGVPEKVSKKVQ